MVWLDPLQGPEHPRPGQPFAGTHRTCFFPNNREGKEIVQLLSVAFERRLIFDVGESVTLGAAGGTRVVW